MIVFVYQRQKCLYIDRSRKKAFNVANRAEWTFVGYIKHETVFVLLERRI